MIFNHLDAPEHDPLVSPQAVKCEQILLKSLNLKIFEDASCDKSPYYTLLHLGKLSIKKNRGFSEFGTISLRTPPPYTNSEKHNSENWSIFLIPSLPIEIVNKTLNYIIKFVTFESTE